MRVVVRWSQREVPVNSHRESSPLFTLDLGSAPPSPIPRGRDLECPTRSASAVYMPTRRERRGLSHSDAGAEMGSEVVGDITGVVLGAVDEARLSAPEKVQPDAVEARRLSHHPAVVPEPAPAVQ